MEWKTYMKDRLIAEHPEGFYVIRPVEPLEAQPVFCPVCDDIMHSYYDEEAYRKFRCCDNCASTWAYADVERWNSGWRPSSEEVKNNCKKVPI